MLTDEHRERLRTYLVVAEGLRLKPYTDTVGKLSIGIGRNLTDVGITAMEAYMMCDHDMDRAYDCLLKRYPWFTDQDPVRQLVLIELMFNMGPASFATFVNTLAAFRLKDYPKAAAGLKASKWYRQVQKARSDRLIEMTLTGEWV